MQKKWRIGLVGIGRGSAYGRVLADHPRCEIASVCDASSEALERFGKEFNLPDSRRFNDYAQFLSYPDLDVVFIGTPIPFHAEQTIQALKVGKHVLSEVTAASTLLECAKIVETVQRTGKIYMLAENCVFWPFVDEWKHWVSAGRLGEIAYAEAEYLHPIPEAIYDQAAGAPKWRAARAPLHYCSHSLGPILEILGDKIVRGMGCGQGHRLLPEAPVGGIDMQVALFETKKGAIIKLLRTSVLPRVPRIHYYSLYGTKGYLETHRGGLELPGRIYVKSEMEKDQEIAVPLADASLPESARKGGHGTAEYSLMQHFLDCLDAQRKPRIDEVRAMDFTVPGLVAHESAMKGGIWMDVPSFD